MNKVELKDLVGGALQEKFAKSFERVIENLQDPNTPYKNKRAVTIKMTFEQNELRDDVKVGIDVSEKLSAQSPMKTNFYIGKDLETGEIVAEEYGKQVKGQISLEEYQNESKKELTGNQNMQVIGDDLVDTETGEVLDFRAAASN